MLLYLLLVKTILKNGGTKMFQLANFSSSQFSPQERIEEIIDFVISPSNFLKFERGESCNVGQLSPCQASILTSRLHLLGYVVTKTPEGYLVRKF